MICYSKKDIERVRAANKISDVISEMVPIQEVTCGNTRSIIAECPFDQEKGFTLLVSDKTQTYQCVECGATGDVFSFVMDFKKISLMEAVDALAARAGIGLPARQNSNRGEQEVADILAMNREAALFYHRNLRKGDPEGLEYLRARGLTEDTIRRFGLGYAGSRPDELYRFLRSKGFSDKQLELAGLVSFYNGAGYDKFRSRVMCPIIDTEGQVLGFSGRVIGDGEPKYKNTPSTLLFDKKTVLFGIHAAQKTKEDAFIICEGNFDVISLHQAGFDNAVAPLGTAFTKEHAMTLVGYTNQAHLVYDNDEAGQLATARVIPILQNAGIRCDVVGLAPYKDPDELLKAEGADAFRKRLQETERDSSFEVRYRWEHSGCREEDLRKIALEILRKPRAMQEEYLKTLKEQLNRLPVRIPERDLLDDHMGEKETASTEKNSGEVNEDVAAKQVEEGVLVDTSWITYENFAR